MRKGSKRKQRKRRGREREGNNSNLGVYRSQQCQVTWGASSQIAKSLSESQHDVEFVTWPWKGDGVNNLVSSQSAHMTTLHLFRVGYAVVADEGNGLQLRSLAVNIPKEQNVSDSLHPEGLDEHYSIRKLLSCITMDLLAIVLQ